MRHTDMIGTRWPATAEPTPSDSLATRAVGVSCRAVTEVFFLAIELQRGLMSSGNQGSQMMDMHTCIHTHTRTHARTHARARARAHTHTHTCTQREHMHTHQGSLQGSYGEIETRLAFLGLRQMALAGKHVLVYGLYLFVSLSLSLSLS